MIIYLYFAKINALSCINDLLCITLVGNYNVFIITRRRNQGDINDVALGAALNNLNTQRSGTPTVFYGTSSNTYVYSVLTGGNFQVNYMQMVHVI